MIRYGTHIRQIFDKKPSSLQNLIHFLFSLFYQNRSLLLELYYYPLRFRSKFVYCLTISVKYVCHFKENQFSYLMLSCYDTILLFVSVKIVCINVKHIQNTLYCSIFFLKSILYKYNYCFYYSQYQPFLSSPTKLKSDRIHNQNWEDPNLSLEYIQHLM